MTGVEMDGAAEYRGRWHAIDHRVGSPAGQCREDYQARRNYDQMSRYHPASGKRELSSRPPQGTRHKHARFGLCLASCGWTGIGLPASFRLLNKKRGAKVASGLRETGDAAQDLRTLSEVCR